MLIIMLDVVNFLIDFIIKMIKAPVQVINRLKNVISSLTYRFKDFDKLILIILNYWEWFNRILVEIFFRR
jgi:hypothetical protein